jgi:hypothetical protein
MIVILHSGQTGVERGAHRAAVARGLPVGGFGTSDSRDELGVIPADVLGVLTPCAERGPRQAVRANIMAATAAMIVIPRIDEARAATGIAEVLTLIRARALPMLVCDPLTTEEEVFAFRRGLSEPKLAVIGPRATRWKEGESVARRLVAFLART